MVKTRKYSCVKCGSPLEVYPPDSKHTQASRDDRLCDRSIKVEHKCEKCGNINVIYWCDFMIPDWYA
jgi:hypothetical protein